MWFATHGEESLFGAARSDAFLVGQIALAMKLGENIHVEGPVSSRLAHGMEIYQQILNVWWPECFSRIEIKYEQLDSRLDETRPGGVASCFSGGVDSYHSLAELMEPQLSVSDFRVTHALMVNGFDQMDDLEHKGVTRQLLNVYRPALASWGIELVMLDSNLKQFRNPILHISELIHSFNGQLASCGLALAGIFGRFGMSGHASFSYEEMRPGGSHLSLIHI